MSIIFLLLIFLFIKEFYINNVFLIIDITSSFLSYILNYFSLFDKKMEENIKLLFGNINKNKIREIKYKSLKIYIFNILLVLNTRILLDKNNNYFKKNNINEINEKSYILLSGHYGIFYSFLAFTFKCNKQFSFLYKMKNKIMDKFIFPKEKLNKIGIYPYLSNEMSKYQRNNKTEIYQIVFDHYYSKGIEVSFFDKKFKSHTSPAILHKKKKLPIYLCFSYYNFNKKIIEIKIEKVNINENDSIQDIMQNIFNIYEIKIKEDPCKFIWLQKNIYKNNL